MMHVGKLLYSINAEQQGKAEDDEKRNHQLYVSQVSNAMASKGGGWDDSTVNNILSPLHPATRSMVSQSYGQLEGQKFVDGLAAAVPPNVLQSPEQAQAWMKEQRQKALQQAGNVPFYSAGYMQSVEQGLSGLISQANSQRIQGWNQTILDAKKTEWVNSTSGNYNPVYAPNRADAQTVVQTASNLNMDPRGLSAILALESAHNPNAKGGKDNLYEGLIQFGPWEQQHYKVNRSTPFAQQMVAAEQFLRDRGFKATGNLEQDVRNAYKAINPGAFKTGEGDELVKRMLRGDKWQEGLKFLGVTNDASSFGQALLPKEPYKVASAGGTVPVPSGNPNANPADIPFGSPKAQIAGPDVPWDAQRMLDSFAKSDAEVGATTPWLKAQLKDAAAQTFMQKALDLKDQRYLQAFPQHLLNAEQKHAYSQAAQHIAALKVHDLAEDARKAKEAQEAIKDGLITNIDTKMANGQPLSVQDAYGPDGKVNHEAFQYFLQQREINARVSPMESKLNKDNMMNDIQKSVIDGQWERVDPSLKGTTPDEKTLRELIRWNPNINSTEKAKLSEDLRNTLTVANIVNSQQVTDSYDAKVKPFIDAINKNPVSSPLGKLVGANYSGAAKTFFQNEILSHLRALPALPTGQQEKQIVDESIKATIEHLNLMQKLVTESSKNPEADAYKVESKAKPAEPAKAQFKLQLSPDGKPIVVPNIDGSKPKEKKEEQHTEVPPPPVVQHVHSVDTNSIGSMFKAISPFGN
ncbi:hypothetical protein M2323_004518 [Rhodoblastus acidophilus]|uniref:hypothetical protein n=1 Tax=Rhodoblastus acidophilus TaxID=1074 RepID=UPI00222479EA|nr:hypothetical protein [Rhodoblastus acidophilus]MCW2286632.1 hypothetical protein [Rhodoblastus acidophilus]MCW2335568.1 hypothetical protein [Rhodoblastus acidophilus]